jgi:hypothetical protein
MLCGICTELVGFNFFPVSSERTRGLSPGHNARDFHQLAEFTDLVKNCAMTRLRIRGSVHPIEVKDCSLWPIPMTSQRMAARKRCQTRTYLQRRWSFSPISFTLRKQTSTIGFNVIVISPWLRSRGKRWPSTCAIRPRAI